MQIASVCICKKGVNMHSVRAKPMFSCIAASTQPCKACSVSLVQYYDADHVVASTQPCKPIVQHYDADHVAANTQPCKPCSVSVVHYYADDDVMRVVPSHANLALSQLLNIMMLNRQTAKPTHQPISQLTYLPTSQPTSQPANKSTRPPFNQNARQPISQQTSQTVNRQTS